MKRNNDRKKVNVNRFVPAVGLFIFVLVLRSFSINLESKWINLSVKQDYCECYWLISMEILTEKKEWTTRKLLELVPTSTVWLRGGSVRQRQQLAEFSELVEFHQNSDLSALIYPHFSMVKT